MMTKAVDFTDLARTVQLQIISIDVMADEFLREDPNDVLGVGNQFQRTEDGAMENAALLLM